MANSIDADIARLSNAIGKAVADSLQKPGPGGSGTTAAGGSGIAALAETARGVIGAGISGVMRVGSGGAGGSVLEGSFKILSTTIGTTLTPVLAVFSAGVIAVSDYLWEKLLPNLDQWVAWVVKMGNSAAEFIENLEKFLPSASVVKQNLEHVGDLFEGNFSKLNDNFHRDFLGWSDGDFKRDDGGKGGEIGGGDFSRPWEQKPSRFQSAFKDVLTEMRLKQGTTQGYMSITDAARRAQEAAFQSPFEARMLKVTEDMLKAMEKVATNTGKEAVYEKDDGTDY